MIGMPLPKNTWRLLISEPSIGAKNMAIDEAIVEAVGRGEAPPTLRLYAWAPPCLSLGHAQPVADVSLDALKERGWDLVRRPTGGRAILHADELTYSVCGLSSDPRLEGGVLSSYRVLSRALLRALQLIGIEAEARENQQLANASNQRKSGSDQNPVCFEESSDYEITYLRKKLIGSAQARRKETVLQHGSLPLYGDLTRIVQVLHIKDDLERDDAARRLQARATSVEQALGRKITWEYAAQAFVSAFAETLNLEFRSGTLSQAEIDRADNLVDEKYANWTWTGRI